MHRRDNESHTVNNYISGGVGGAGGAGSAQGQGGDGGTGEGPELNYAFDAIENFTMNNLGLQIQDSNLYTVSGDVSLIIQNSQLRDSHLRLPVLGRGLELGADWSEGSGRELSDTTRSPHRPRYEIGTRHTPYNISSRSHLSITNLTEHNPPSSHTSFSTSVLDFLSRSSQISRTQTAPPITLPPFRLAFPPSGPQSTHPSKCLSRIQGFLSDCSTPGSESGPSNPPLTGPIEHPSPHDRTLLSYFSTPPSQNYKSGGRGGDSLSAVACQYHRFDAPRSVHGSTFITAENINHQHGEAGIHILAREIALEALYNSAESFPQPKCHPETRKELLNELYQWATDSHSDQSVRWLHGPAGAGKSAVMQTLCQRLHAAGRLGGSFFFKRGHPTRGNSSTLFATLAYQLALHRPELKGPISRIVEQDPSFPRRNMDVQLYSLILEPSKSLPGNTPFVLLIDGLDECDGHDIQREILHLIGTTGSKKQARLRILIASRAEAHIRETFEGSLRGVADSTNIQQSFEDIRTYLRDEFSRIHHKHSTMKNIPTPWPSPQILDSLVERSSGYFIYASTAIRFIDDEYFWPCKQLDIIIQNLPLDLESPFATLDELYIQILKGVPSRHLGILSDILSAVVQFPSRFRPRDVDELLSVEPGTVELILCPLHSVLQIVKEKYMPPVIQVHHASFLDFLKDETRSLSFYVGSAEHKTKLGHSILRALSYTYDNPQRNLADLDLYWYVEVHSQSKPILILQYSGSSH
ncbi:putative nwd2 protein [Mycena venus]|uniref:Putative nwd2 protein n=1 Tax=Mycena venus TaxID=2733690 RepID=A0A8H7CVJ5_9AGAR|nr:putative nwd2 protein [Mycena venus]